MAQLKDLLVAGPGRVLNDLYVQSSIYVTNGIKIGSANELKSFGTGLSLSSAGVLSASNNGTVTQIVAGTGLTGGTITTSGTIAVNFGGTGSATTVARSDHTHSYLPLSGGTMTGTLTAKANVYDDTYTGALNMANSNIYGVNAIYFADSSDSQAEGINFYRSATATDTIYAYNGKLYFVPNRTLGQSGTAYEVLTTLNYISNFQTNNPLYFDTNNKLSLKLRDGAPLQIETEDGSLTVITGTVAGTVATGNHTHTTVVGSYTSGGGKQNPNYFGTNKVGFLMMNTTVNNNSQYKDWIIMDCYSGNDVGGGVAFGVNRQALGAYIMRSDAARTSWAASAELIGTHNYTSYTVTKTGTGASGTWGINITGSAASAGKATNDASNRAIETTYAHSLMVSGNTIGLEHANGEEISGSFITVPYATSAGSATTATTATNASNLLGGSNDQMLVSNGTKGVWTALANIRSKLGLGDLAYISGDESTDTGKYLCFDGSGDYSWRTPGGSYLPLTGGTLARSSATTAAVLAVNQTYATATTWISGIDIYAPSLSPNSAASSSNFAAINFGRSATAYMAGNLTFHYTSSSTPASNWISLGLNSHDHILNITGSHYVGINQTAPTAPLEVRQSTAASGAVLKLTSLYTAGTAGWGTGIYFMMPNAAANSNMSILEGGVTGSTNNSASFQFHYISSGSTSNYASYSLYGNDDFLCYTGTRRVGVNTTSPGYTLDVSGTINASSTISVAGRNVLRTFGPTDGGTEGYDGLVPSPGTDGGRVLTGDSGWGKVTDSYLSGRLTMVHMPAGTNGQVLIAKGTTTSPAWGNLALSLTKTGTASISLSSNTTYTLTVGNSTYAFTTPVDNVGPCLIEGTKILMADGSEKNIEDVVEGDSIKSYDPSTRQLCEAIVIANRETGRSNDYVNYYFEDGSFLTIFGDHLLYSANEGTARINTAWEPGWTGINANGEEVAFIGTEDVSGVGHKRHYDLHSSNKLYYANGILNAQSLTSDYTRFFNPEWPESYKAALKEDYDISVAVNQHKTNHKVGAQMVPILKELKKQKRLMDDNKKLLADSDYIVSKFTEGLISAAEWLKAKANRAGWRQLVNDAETAYNAAKARYNQFKSQFNPSTTRSERFAAAVARDNACLNDLKAYYANIRKGGN